MRGPPSGWTLPEPSTACTVTPVRVQSLREPRRIAELRERCVRVRGWWGTGAVFVDETRDAAAGYRVLRPFSFVRERNSDLGSPSWAALDAILVDEGWIRTDQLATATLREAADEQMFEEPVEVEGVVRSAPAEAASGLWTWLQDHRPDGPRYAANLLPIVLQRSTGSEDQMAAAAAEWAATGLVLDAAGVRWHDQRLQCDPVSLDCDPERIGFTCTGTTEETADLRVTFGPNQPPFEGPPEIDRSKCVRGDLPGVSVRDPR
ncbi:MAG: SURF1 family cytochrome oxidase biogenesis protein [Myxococcota bacterium]